MNERESQHERENLHDAIRTMETKITDKMAEQNTNIAVLSNEIENINKNQTEAIGRSDKLFDIFYKDLKETRDTAKTNKGKILNTQVVIGIVSLVFIITSLFFGFMTYG